MAAQRAQNPKGGSAPDKVGSGSEKELLERVSELERRIGSTEERIKALDRRAGAGRRGPPPGEPPGAPLSAEEPGRRELQLFFGEFHGLLDDIVRGRGPSVSSDFPSLLPEYERESLAKAYSEIAAVFGRLQAELNTGEYDEKLGEHGLAGEQFIDKLRRWGMRLGEFVRDRTPRAALRAIHPGAVILGSAAAMLPKWAVEPIKEFVQSVDEVISDSVAGQR